MVAYHKSLDTVLDALADPTRRAIVEMLVQRPYRATELAADLGISRSRMSKHLRLLLEAGVVRDERLSEDARARVFHLQPDVLYDMQVWLDDLKRHWDMQLHAFKQHLEGRERNE